MFLYIVIYFEALNIYEKSIKIWKHPEIIFIPQESLEASNNQGHKSHHKNLVCLFENNNKNNQKFIQPPTVSQTTSCKENHLHLYTSV